MINFKSESANKTQQNNAKILFGKSGLTIIKKLEEYSKEKQLDTAGIDALLDVLKTKDTALLEKFASSKTGKTLVTNCEQLAKAKTFSAVIKNIKAIKPLKSFDRFSAPSSKSPVESKRPIRKGQSTPAVDKGSPRFEGSRVHLPRRGPFMIEYSLPLHQEPNDGSFYYQNPEFKYELDLLIKHDLGLAESGKTSRDGTGFYIYGTKENLNKLIKTKAYRYSELTPKDIVKAVAPKPRKTQFSQVKRDLGKNISFNVQDPASYATGLSKAEPGTAKYKKLAKLIEKHARRISNIPENWNVRVLPEALNKFGYFLTAESPEMQERDAKGRLPRRTLICLGGMQKRGMFTKEWLPDSKFVTAITQIHYDDAGKTKRMSYEQALNYMVAENSKIK